MKDKITMEFDIRGSVKFKCRCPKANGRNLCHECMDKILDLMAKALEREDK